MKEIKGKYGGVLHVQEKGEKPEKLVKPKGAIHFKTRVKKFLEGDTSVLVDGSKVKMTREEALIHRLFDISQNGDETKFGESKGVSIAAIRELLDRVYGRAVQQVSGPDEGPIKFGIDGVGNMPDDVLDKMIELAKKAT